MVEYPWRCYYFMSMPEVSRSRTSLEHNMSVFVLRRMALRVVAVGVLIKSHVERAQSCGTLHSGIRPGPRTMTITLQPRLLHQTPTTCSIMRYQMACTLLDYVYSVDSRESLSYVPMISLIETLVYK